jgi:hypothetical protein
MTKQPGQCTLIIEALAGGRFLLSAHEDWHDVEGEESSTVLTKAQAEAMANMLLGRVDACEMRIPAGRGRPAITTEPYDPDDLDAPIPAFVPYKPVKL